MTLGDALASGRTGNLDTLRLVLAACVIVSHAWPLALGPGTAEPLHHLTGHSLGGWAVALFFFLSGLLVTASAERRGMAEFWAARARRILPALAGAVAVTLVLAMASGATATAGEATVWALRAITLVSIEHRLTGAFALNPYAGVVNGPLWSLFHEIAAYAVCQALVLAGITRRPAAVLVLVAVTGALSLAAHLLPGRAAVFAPLFAAFALGMAAHVFRDRLPLRPVLALALVPLVFVPIWPVAVAAAAYALLVATLRMPGMRPGQDLSFGLYLYGWPVAQGVVHLASGIGPFELAALSLLATLPFAWASWHLIERPRLSPRPSAA